MARSLMLAGALLATQSLATFHYGAAFGSPYNTSTDCVDIDNIQPELLINWGPDNRDDATTNICNNPNINFLPYLWGQTWDDSELNALPNSPTPWGIILENEPNWWGGEPLTDQHGDGCNMTAAAAAARYPGHVGVINNKWGGVDSLKLISPSPVNKYYPNCTYEPEQGCAFQPQLAWLDEYFADCDCYDDMWAINLHDYSCNLADSQSLVADLKAHFPGKNIFFGELGCNGPTPQEMAQYLTDFVSWAYYEPAVVGFIWSAINDSVGTEGTQLSVDGTLHPVGQAFKTIQQQYPPVQ